MKKTALLATTIASILASSTVAAETTFFGDIQLGVVSMAEVDMDGSTFMFGFDASEDMGNGLTGFMHIELIHDNADKLYPNDNPGTDDYGIQNDVSYVGIKGGFGQVTLGKQSDAAGFACGGTDLFNYNGGAACGVGAANDNLDNAITYANTMDALSFVVGMTIDGSKDGVTPLPGDHLLLAAQYAADNFSIGGQLTSPDSDTGADDLLVIGGTFSVNDIVIGLTLADDGTDTATSIGVTVPMAGGELVAAVDTGDSIDDETNIGFHKSLSKSMYAGIEFTTWDVADDDMIGAYLGMTF